MLVLPALTVTLGLALQPEPPTWEDVRPLVERHCAGCHAARGSAGVTLLEPRHFWPRRRLARRLLERGEMPPWLPRGEVPHFEGERRLPAADRELLLRWLESPTPPAREARPAEPPPLSDWQLGEPDLVLVSQVVEVPADGRDVFRNLVLSGPRRGPPRWVEAVELRPRTPDAIHHVVLTVDETRSSRELDARDEEPGFPGMSTESRAVSPGGQFIGWTPGKRAVPAREGVAWRLRAGSDLVVLLHLLPSETARTAQIEVGLHFTDRPPTRRPIMLRLGSMDLTLAPGDRDVEVLDRFRLPTDAVVTSLYPHAHYRARSMQAWAVTPEGGRVELLDIPRWDFHWQDQYRLTRPLALPAGSEIEMRYLYDAAEGAVQAVRFGPSSLDEMADLWIELFAATEDEEPLALAASRHQLANAERGLRKALARTLGPSERRDKLFALGDNLLRQGTPVEAAARFRDALALDPDHVPSLTNLGNLLHQSGRSHEAEPLLRRAASRAPTSVDALFLGNLRLALGETERALDTYQRALQVSLGRAAVWLNVGIAHHRLGDHDAAVRAFRQAAELDPQSPSAFVNLALVLEQQGKIDEARQALRRAHDILPDDERLLEIEGRLERPTSPP